MAHFLDWPTESVSSLEDRDLIGLCWPSFREESGGMDIGVLLCADKINELNFS